MDDNECNNQLRATLHDVFGLEDSDSLHDEDLSVSDGEENHYGEDNFEEEEGPMHDDSYTEEQYTADLVEVTKIILEHNHELEPALSYFFPCHKKLRRTVKRSLVAHDITGLRPSKSIRLLEVEAGGLERMRIWLTAMGEIPLTAILIDQCESIKAAIGEVLPNTIHRNDEVNHINSKKKFIVVAVVEDMKPTKESSDDIQRDTKRVFKAMAELDEQMRRSQDHLEFMIIRINATEERFEVIRKEIFDQYRKDQANFLQLKQHRHILCS
ncbi:hypothetical protein P3S68_020630 [Capsicum galapagoense]